MTSLNINDTLNQNAHTLLEKGSHIRSLCNVAKLAGTLGLLSGALACGTGNVRIGGAAAAIGGVLYIGAIGRELDTTGRVMPVPFSSMDIGYIARSAGVAGEKSPAPHRNRLPK